MADTLAHARCVPSGGDPFRFTELLADGSPAVYVTPWCVAVDRVSRTMYDARLCASRGLVETLTTRAALAKADCALVPQPLDLLADPTYGTLNPSAPLSPPYELELSTSLTLSQVCSSFPPNLCATFAYGIVI